MKILFDGEWVAPLRIWYYRRWCWICRLCPYPTVGFDIPRWRDACEEAEIHFNLCHPTQRESLGYCSTASAP